MRRHLIRHLAAEPSVPAMRGPAPRRRLDGVAVRRAILGAAAAVACLFALSACQQTPATGAQPVRFAPVDGVGYIIFNAPIASRSRDFLIADMEGLIAAGARTLRVALSSPGGEVEAARGIVAFMNDAHARRGIDFEFYDVGVVASAATYVFLSAQRRFAGGNTGFLFHAAGVVGTGPISAERLREAADRIDDYERLVRDVLKSRTHLPDAAIDVYLHRTVILTADDARRDGVIDAVKAFPAPSDAPVVVIGVRPASGQSLPAVPPTNGTR